MERRQLFSQGEQRMGLGDLVHGREVGEKGTGSLLLSAHWLSGIEPISRSLAGYSAAS